MASQALQRTGSTSNVSPSKYRSIPSFARIDINAIKQELHDVLGENGLPYWRVLNGYLVGQVGRLEMEAMVKTWLKGPDLHLHNDLLKGLLYNASAPPSSLNSANGNLSKRRRLNPSDPEFDTDEVRIEPKARVHGWVMGLGAQDRHRIRQSVIQRAEASSSASGGGVGMGEGGSAWDRAIKGKRGQAFDPSTYLPPLSTTERQLPSANQLALRLGQISKSYDLTIDSDAQADIGEFMAVGLDSHLSDMLHHVVRTTGRDRRGVDTIHLPLTGHTGDQEDGIQSHKSRQRSKSKGQIQIRDGLGNGQGDASIYINGNGDANGHGNVNVSGSDGSPFATKADRRASALSPEISNHLMLPPPAPIPTANHIDGEGLGPTANIGSPYLPPPDISTMQHLFTMIPEMHPQSSPALYKLTTSATLSESAAQRALLEAHGREQNNEDEGEEAGAGAGSLRDNKSGSNTQERTHNRLSQAGMLKLDKADEKPEGQDGKKAKKHNLHWRYEDPSWIFKDLLG